MCIPRQWCFSLKTKLPPMVQNHYLVRDINAGSFQFANGGNHMLGPHVALRIIIEMDEDNSGMGAVGSSDHFVKIIKVVPIGSQDSEPRPNRKGKVPSVRGAGEINIGRDRYRVASPPQERNENDVEPINIQINVHDG